MKVPNKLKPLISKLGITKPHKQQLEPISSIRKGNDTLVVAPTSWGKSLVYQLTAMEHEDKTTLVIEPTISLMHDQVNKLTGHGINAAYLDSSQSQNEANKVLDKLAKGLLNILYVTPERLSSEKFLDALKHVDVYMVAVDECHCVTEWGYSFRKHYLHIGDFIDSLKHRPIVVALTATASDDQCEEIRKLLHMNPLEPFRYSLDRPNLSFIFKHIDKKCEDDIEEKYRVMLPYIRKARKSGSVVIYCLTRDRTADVYNRLYDKFGDDVTYTSGELPSKRRNKNELKFLNGECGIIVATSAFGMGIDKADIRLVVHFDTPLSIGEYYQQAGRAGRDDEKAQCLLLYYPGDYCIGATLIEHNNSVDSYKATEKKLKEMHDLAKSSGCITRQILAAFDEDTSHNCKRCSNCNRKRRGDR